MARIGVFRFGMLCWASLGMMVPAPALQAAETPPPLQAAPDAVQSDVALHVGGVLLGQVVDGNGSPLPNAPVALRQADREVAAAVTEASGYFLLSGLRGGTHEIAVGPTRQVHRIWAPGTAPPSAQDGALVVVGERTTRGQQGPIGYWLSNPWVVAGLVAAAVAIPVAIHNNRVQRTASP